MKNLPVINSQVQILRMEVWVTNRTGATTEYKGYCGTDGPWRKQNPYQQPPVIIPSPGRQFPSNGSNDLYAKIVNDPNST